MNVFNTILVNEVFWGLAEDTKIWWPNKNLEIVRRILSPTICHQLTLKNSYLLFFNGWVFLMLLLKSLKIVFKCLFLLFFTFEIFSNTFKKKKIFLLFNENFLKFLHHRSKLSKMEVALILLATIIPFTLQHHCLGRG